MGKRSNETEEERRERKRQKKEKKELKKAKKEQSSQDGSTEVPIPTTPAPALRTPEPMSTQSRGPPTFLRKKLRLTVSLLPAGLANVLQSIEDNLRLFLLKYSDGVGGIMLAFDNVDLDGRGEILNELPYTHYKVTCDALIFAPQPGCCLRGEVTESFPSHVSLVVHKYFNASVAASDLQAAGMEFEDDCWYAGGQALVEGGSLEFVVDKVHESGGIISMDGSNPKLR